MKITSGEILFAVFGVFLALSSDAQPVITNQPINQTVVSGGNATFSVMVTGIGPFTYQWRLNGSTLPNNIITTAAGNGSATFAGDGGVATNASLNGPPGVAFDNSGSLYIADSSNNRIRKLDANGIITTVAGDGSGIFAGDGGIATNASLSNPSGVACDTGGNFFIADTGNFRIRKVDTNGTITTVAGNGIADYTGDGGAATNASLNSPSGVAIDAGGSLYFADSQENCVRKVATNGIITTVVGGGNPSGDYEGGPYASNNAALYSPNGLAFDVCGNLYISDQGNNRIRKVATNGLISTIAGIGAGGDVASGDGGAATNASINYPSGLAFDSAGNLYIAADYNNNDVRRVDTNGIITTVAGAGNGNYGGGAYAGDGGAATNASLSSPGGLAFDTIGNLYIADWGNNRIRELHFAGDSTFRLNSVSTRDSGNYTVVVNSAYGSVTSAVAELTVVFPPAIVNQPASQGVSAGSNAVLNVTASGTQALNYLWYFNTTNQVQNGTNSSLLVTSFGAGDVGQYLVVVTNAYGSVTSSVAILEFPPAVSVTVQPASQIILAGSNVTFSVAVAGIGPFRYQWLFNGTNLPTGIITTVAGGGGGGDGGEATNANLYGPAGIALDSLGNMYIADGGHNSVRKVDISGIITTVAGNGNGDYSGDGVAATNTSLSSPNGIVVDAFGNLYIADSANERVRKVDINGIITTVVGNDNVGYSGGFSGDGGPSTNATADYPFGLTFDVSGNLYIADAGNNRVRKVDTNGIITTVAGNGTAAYSGDGNSATNAALNYPISVVVDPLGVLYVGDYNNNVVRKVNTNGVITTYAGGGSGGDGGAATNAALTSYDYVGSPLGVALDATGNLYIADGNKCSVRKVDTNSIITTVAGNGIQGFAGDGGVATNASLNVPYALAMDSLGNLYIADTGNNRIRELHLNGVPNLLLAGITNSNAGSYSVVISNPYGSVTSSVALLSVVLPPTILVQPVSLLAVSGSNVTLNVMATGTQPLDYSWYFNSTNLVQSGTSDTLILSGVNVSNTGNYVVVVTNAYSSATSQVATLTVGLPPSVIISGGQTVLAGSSVVLSATAGGTGPLTYQWSLNGTTLLNDFITTVAGNGTAKYTGDNGKAINASLNFPGGVALDVAANLYIADANNNRIRKVDTNGLITTVAGGGNGGDGADATNASLNTPSGVALDAAGNLYIADSQNGRIRKVDTNGIISTVAGGGSGSNGGAATNAGLISPRAVTFDSFGNLYIAETGNNQVRKVDTNGIISAFAGGGSGVDGSFATNASLNFPSGVTFDGSGNLYIGDSHNNRIRKVDVSGIITTVAGTGSYGYSGDGNVASMTSLSYPAGVSLDAAGNLYIADNGASRIRRVDSASFVSTVAGDGIVGFSGDSGPGTSAKLAYPYGVVSDTFGNIYFADSGNNRIRKVVLDAGNPILTLSSVSAYNAGEYSVVVTSPYGSVKSSVTELTVEAPPVISTQPASQIAIIGSSVVLQVAAVGSGPFGYSWYLASTNLVQNGTNGLLYFSNIAINDGGNYIVVVTNNYGSVTSQVATLAVAVPPTANISGNQVVDAGSNAAFSVTTSGTGPFYFIWCLDGTDLPKPGMIIAGGGTFGKLGDGGAQATNASLANPSAATADAQGNIFITDMFNNRIRKVATNGVITTVAGNGAGSPSVSGLAATNTGLSLPTFALVDPAGDIFIAEQDANWITEVATNGIITHIAGKGGIVFGGDGGQATNASLYGPCGIALDAFGNVFVADTEHNRVRKVSTNGIITTVAGGSTQGFSGDGGFATNAALNRPNAIIPDRWGNLFIADTLNNRIREVASNGIITTIAGNGTAEFSGDGGLATNAGLCSPKGLTLDAIGNLLIADTCNERIRQVDPNGIITTVAGFSFIGGYLGNPSSVAVDARGNILIADTSYGLIIELPAWGPNFVITNVGVANAGSYTVIINSPYGSVTSTVAALTVIVTPRSFAGSVDAGTGVKLQFIGTPNYAYTLQASTNLAPPVNWQSLITQSTDTNGVWLFIDTNELSLPACFYRVVAQ